MVDFEAGWVPIQGDCVIGVFWGERAMERAFCAAVTVKTFSEKTLAPELAAKWPDAPATGFKIGMATSPVLVKRVGRPRSNFQALVWPGKALNYAVKAAQSGDVWKLIVTGSVWDALEGNDYIEFTTAACRAGCVAAQSANARLDRSQRARLARTLLVLVGPAEALALTARQLDRLRQQYGRRGARRRVNVADDVRWELLAPGLLSLGPRPYTYTKWSPAERPGRPGLRIVYSATERHSDAELVERCAAGHRVCGVFDLPRSVPLPAVWHGVRVVDGDKTDDLWRHRAGSIVGLHVKGRLAQREIMRTRGFARPAARVSVPLQIGHPPSMPLAA